MGYIAVALLLTVEFFVFRHHVLKQIAPYHPTHYDQAYYLATVYKHYFECKDAASWQPLFDLMGSRPIPTAFLLPTTGVMSMMMFGPDRFSALLVNFFAWAVMQVTVYLAVTSITRRPVWGLLAVALCLVQMSPYYERGGIYDFRPDFVAYCYYGCFISALAASRGLRRMPWVWATAAFGAITVFYRTIAILSITGVLGLVLGWIIVQYVRAKLKHRPEAIIWWRSGWRAVLVIFFACALIVPLLLLNFKGLHDYYIVGHVTGAERDYRIKELGITEAWKLYMFYPNTMADTHLGLLFGITVLVMLAGAFVAAGFRFRIGSWIRGLRRYAGCIAVLAAGTVLPLIIMSGDTTKSPVVASFPTIPATVLVALLLYHTFRYAEPWAPGLLRQMRGARQLTGAASILTAVAVIAGTSFLVVKGLRRGDVPRATTQLKRDKPGMVMPAEIMDFVTRELTERNILACLIATNLADDAFFSSVFNVWAWERYGKRTAIYGGLPITTNAADADTMARGLSNSKFAIIERHPDPGISPMRGSWVAAEPRLLDILDRRFVRTSTFNMKSEMKEIPVEVYAERPEWAVMYINGGWMTEYGLEFRIRKVLYNQPEPVRFSLKINGADATANLKPEELTATLVGLPASGTSPAVPDVNLPLEVRTKDGKTVIDVAVDWSSQETNPSPYINVRVRGKRHLTAPAEQLMRLEGPTATFEAK